MTAFPRIITVDPSRAVARIVRSVLDLTERSAVQIDVPTSTQALKELQHGGCRVIIVSLTTDDDLSGDQLVEQARAIDPQIAIVLLADPESDLDPARFTDTRALGFVYVPRPVEIHQFMRVLIAALDGRDVFSAQQPQVTGSGAAGLADLGEPPTIDSRAAERICDRVLSDVSAKSVLLADRTGRVVVERGAIGFIDRVRLTEALLPSVLATIEMGKVVGGKFSTMTIYDGDDYDVFVLAVGVHHFLSIVFDGQGGSRQVGGVSRYGRRAADDLITLLGADVYLLERPAAPSPEEIRRPHRKTRETAEVEPVLLARADDLITATPLVIEPERLRLEPIADLNLDLIEKASSGTVDESALNDLFDPDKLAVLANESRSSRGPLTYDEARQLGIIP